MGSKVAIPNLKQEFYKDHNGHAISRDAAEYLAAYDHVIDGFYHWSCGGCSEKYTDRACGWHIAGQIIECQKCHAMNLLVRTDFDWINERLGKAGLEEEQARELERLKGVERLNAEDIQRIRQEIYDKVQQALRPTL